MRAQIFSDLHLDFAGDAVPSPAPDADVLIAAGDLGHSPDVLARLAHWPVPVIFVPGNHEYDGADIDDTEGELRAMAADAGIVMLNTDLHEITAHDRRYRFVGCSRWWDFDLLGEQRRAECMRWGERYLRQMGSSRHGRMLSTDDVRAIALSHRAWLEATLRTPFVGVTIAITHAGPSALSADPRYGLVPGTASFCNGDDDLVPLASLWVHGHLHCRQDYTIGTGRVVCNPRGYERLREHETFVPQLVIDLG